MKSVIQDKGRPLVATMEEGEINVIEESIGSNHFWENWITLNKHKELSIQNGDVWVNHFSNLFGPITKDKQQKHIHDQIQIVESTIKDYQNPLDSTGQNYNPSNPKRTMVLMESSMK